MTNTLARVVRARDALEDGDLYLAATILADLEHDLASDFSSTTEKFRCPECGSTFRWPGELDDHRRFVHFDLGSPALADAA
jgi:hypothetical protein